MNRNHAAGRVLLGVIAFLLAANLLVQMNHPGSRTAQAAGIPDQGAQLQAVVDQLVDVNKKVDSLSSYLQSGDMTVKVKTEKSDKPK